MDLLDELNALGADMDACLNRFMGNKQLLETILKKAPESIEQNKDIIETIDSGNIDGAILKAHTLKGNMGNLSITPLFEAYKDITDLLRANKIEEAKKRTLDIQEIQQKIVDTINSHN